jgi:hypothetical protein
LSESIKKLEQELLRGRATRADHALVSYFADHDKRSVAFRAFLLDFLYAVEWDGDADEDDGMDISEAGFIALIREVLEFHSLEPKLVPDSGEV